MFKSTLNWIAAFAIITLISLSSCSDTTPSAQGVENSIPANASMVMLMNTKQLFEKADMEALIKTSFYQDMLTELEKESSEAKAFFEDPASTGFDLNSNMGIYAAINKEKEENLGLEFALMLPVSDITKIEAILEKAYEKEKLPVSKEENYTKVSINNKTFLIYNDQLLAITNFGEAAQIDAILNPSGDNIRSNENFNKHFKEGKDAMFWMKADEIIASVMEENNSEAKLKSGLAMAQLSESILTDNFMSAYYDFQKGEIDAGVNFDFSPALVEEMGDFMASELAVDYSKYIPQENLGMAASLGIDPAGILNFISKRGFDKMIDGQLKMFQLDLASIKDGITGDMAMAAYPSISEGKEPQIIMALGVKDKAFVQGLVDKYGVLAGIVKDGEHYVMMGGQSMDDPDKEPSKVVLHLKDDVLLASNSMDLINKSLKEGSNEILAEMQKGWMGMYFNYDSFRKYEDQLMNAMMDASDIALSKMLIEYNELKDIRILCKGSNIALKTSLQSSDINSLKRLIEIANKVYEDRETIMEEIEKSLDAEDEFEGFEEEFGETL